MKKLLTTSTIARLSALALLAQIWLSWPLWWPTGRTFPVLPFFENWHFGASIMPTVALLAALVAVLFFAEKRWTAPALLAVLAVHILLDMSRLQVWVWYYWLVFAVLASRHRAGEEAAQSALRWLLAGVYFWGGFNKLTPYFAEDAFPFFCGAFGWMKIFADQKWAAYATAVAEFALAIGLLWPRTRGAFRWVVVGFHAYIVLALSPLALGWNYVVIPWNAAMAATAWLVFSEKNAPAAVPFFPKTAWLRALAALACLAPALNVAHRWPENMAWKMYSGTNPEATFYFRNALKINLPASVSGKIFGHAERRLILDDWTLQEMNVGTAASDRYFRQASRALCGCVASPDSAGVYLLTVERWDKSKEKMRRVPCRELLRK